jgi:hypothetical protein
MAVTAVQNPTTGSAGYDLSLKEFAGEVLAEFQNKNVLMPLHRVKTMPAGASSIQFPALGAAAATYHTAGDNLLTDNDDAGTPAAYLQTLAQGEREIFADREAIAPIFLDKGQERISHWEDRSEYAQALGHALAKQADQMVMRTICKAADASATYTGGPTGYVPAAVAITAASVLDYLLDTQEQFDLNDVPMEDRFCLLRPQEMRLLSTDSATRHYIDRDYESDNGSLKKTIVGEVAGFKLIKITHMPADDYAETHHRISASYANSYAFNASTLKLRSICFQRQAVGTAKAADIALESEYKIELRGDVLVAGYTMGHGILRPECASYLKST